MARPGKKFEGFGCLMICIGIFVSMAAVSSVQTNQGLANAGWIVVGVGFVIFLIGRVA